MAKEPLPMPDKEELREYLEAHTKQETCRYYNVNDRTLNKWIVAYELNQFIRQKIPCPNKEELRQYLKSHTLTEARKKYKVKKTTLDKWLRDLELAKEFQFDHGTMISLAQAAQEVGVSRTMASKWYKKRLIPGATKINKTRVAVPKESIEAMRKLRKTPQQ